MCVWGGGGEGNHHIMGKFHHFIISEGGGDSIYTFHVLQKSVGLPDVHSGYGFAIGNMAAFDVSNPSAVVSPGGLYKCV